MVVQQPIAFFNIVNSVNVFAASGFPLHRLGAAYFNGYLFLSTPRNGDAFGQYYLDLEVNPVNPVAGEPPMAVPGGISWGLRPGGGEVNARILSRVEAFNLAGPIVIWVETPFLDGSDTQGTMWRWFVPKFGPNSPLSPDGGIGPLMPEESDIHTFSFQGQPSTLVDFTTSSANGRIQLLWTLGGDGAIQWAEFDEMAVTPRGTMVTWPGQNIKSIDATAVQMLDPDSGQQVTRIAVVAYSIPPIPGGAPPPALKGWLVDPVSGRSIDLPMPPLPPIVDPISSVIRTTWGAIPTDGVTPRNGLVLSFVPSEGDQNADQDGRDLGVNIIGLGPLLVNMIDLETNKATDWQDVFPDPSVWGASNAGAVGPLSVLFPIPIAQAGQDQVTYYVGLAAAGWSFVEFIFPVSAQPQFIVQFFTGFKLSRTSLGQVQPSGIQPAFTDGDIEAAIGSWTLIGMIAGLPPYFPGDDQSEVTFTYTIGTSTGSTATATTTKAVTAGVTCGPVNASVESSVQQADSTSTVQTLTISFTWSNDSSSRHFLAPDRGILLFWQPDYQHGTYGFANSADVPNDLSLSIIFAGGPGGIEDFEFTLGNLSQATGDDGVDQLLAASFPANDGQSVVTWPRSDDPRSWTGAPPAFWLTQPIANLSSIPIFDTLVDESLFQQTTIDNTQTNTVTISLKLDAELFEGILGVEAGGSLSFESSVQTTFGQSQQFELVYDGLTPGPGVSRFQLRPLLLQPSANGAPWLPGYNGSQRPWLLTWQVEGL